MRNELTSVSLSEPILYSIEVLSTITPVGWELVTHAPTMLLVTGPGPPLQSLTTFPVKSTLTDGPDLSSITSVTFRSLIAVSALTSSLTLKQVPLFTSLG